MSKNILNKKLYIELFILLSLLKKYLFQKPDINNEKLKLIFTAKNFGYDLTNPNDDFFLDICQSFNYHKKDVSLDYKRKYFFFPKNKDITYNFIHPKRNSTHLCFWEFFDISIIYKNIAFLILIPLFFIQIGILLFTLMIEIDQSFNNIPSKKIELQQKYKFFCFRKNNKNKKKQKIFQNSCQKQVAQKIKKSLLILYANSILLTLKLKNQI